MADPAGGVVLLAGLIAMGLLRARRRTAAAQRAGPPQPWNRSEKLSIVGIVAGAAVGVAGLITSTSDKGAERAVRGQPSAPAVAALVRQGPFNVRLPDPLDGGELADVDISDASAADRVDAVQLKVEPAGAVDSFFAHIEVYRSTNAATARVAARIAEIKRLFGANQIEGTPTSYCAYLEPQQTAWECGGASGLAYAEATVSPDANSTRRCAAGSAAALLRYAEERARVASD